MPTSPNANRAYPGFELKRLLGVGATAEVFAAMNLSRQLLVALKVFSPMVSRDPELVKRLEDEAAILSRLKHPNVVSTYGVRNEGGSFALELELIDGQDLRQWLVGTSPQSARAISLIEPKLWVLAQVSRGLGAAHEIGALHRDLKPENILLSKTGEVKITDFGLARTVTRVTLTRVGLLVGSLGYLAPEVINGFRASEQSDIYSLGVIAYELLAGEAPFIGETPQTLIQLMTNGRFTPLCERAPHVPLGIGQLVDRTLNPKPECRPETVWEFEAALMNELSRSGVMRLSKAIIAECVAGSGHEHLTDALREKHQALLARLKSPNANAVDLAEFHRLFSNDEELPALISAFGSRSAETLSRKRKLKGTFTAVALSCGIFAALTVRNCAGQTDLSPIAQVSPTTKFDKAHMSAAPGTVAASMPAAAVPTSASPVAPTSAPPVAPTPARAPATGTLSFEVPNDVSVYVRNELVPPNQLRHYRIAPGRYPMRIERAGFLPIEGQVNVKAGRVSVIRAGGVQ